MSRWGWCPRSSFVVPFCCCFGGEGAIEGTGEKRAECEGALNPEALGDWEALKHPASAWIVAA